VVREGLLTRATLGAAACALTALVYLPFADSPFVLDDRDGILLNPALADAFDWRGMLALDPWRPLVGLSLGLDRITWGISALGFHATNGILHVLVVALLFGLVTRLFADDWAAFLSAAAFGINPLTARSAAYVSARADLLFTAAALLAITFARRAVSRRSRSAAALSAIAAALALMAVPWGSAVHGPLRVYVPAAALAIAAAWGWHAAARGSRVARLAGVAAVAVLIVPTRRALVSWADPVTLWQAEVTHAPDAWDAHLGYAEALREASRCRDAAAQYRDALAINPGLAAARRGLAQCEAAP
jgi:hypothetical protein